MPSKLTIEDFIKKANYKHNNFFDYSKVDYKGSREKIIIICPLHGEYYQEPRIHLEGKGCYNCGGKTKILQDIFIKKCIDLKTKDIFSHIFYESNKSIINPICIVHGEYKIRTDSFLNGNGCQYCSNRKMNTKLFIEKSIKIHNNKYDYSNVKYINRKTKVNIICNTHGEFKMDTSMHLNGYGCNKCSELNITNINKDKFIKKSKKMNNDLYLYDKIDYINNYTKVEIICKKHGVFEQIPNNHIQGAGCPSCKLSKGENIISNFLNVNNINYIPQHKFDNCKFKSKLPFDFYLPDYNMCIEYNGRQHYIPIEYFGGIKSYNEQVKRDNIKVKYCKDNNIELLVIKYTENLFNILNKNILKDLSK